MIKDADGQPVRIGNSLIDFSGLAENMAALVSDTNSMIVAQCADTNDPVYSELIRNKRIAHVFTREDGGIMNRISILCRKYRTHTATGVSRGKSVLATRFDVSGKSVSEISDTIRTGMKKQLSGPVMFAGLFRGKELGSEYVSLFEEINGMDNVDGIMLELDVNGMYELGAIGATIKYLKRSLGVKGLHMLLSSEAMESLDEDNLSKFDEFVSAYQKDDGFTVIIGLPAQLEDRIGMVSSAGIIPEIFVPLGQQVPISGKNKAMQLLPPLQRLTEREVQSGVRIAVDAGFEYVIVNKGLEWDKNIRGIFSHPGSRTFQEMLSVAFNIVVPESDGSRYFRGMEIPSVSGSQGILDLISFIDAYQNAPDKTQIAGTFAADLSELLRHEDFGAGELSRLKGDITDMAKRVKHAVPGTELTELDDMMRYLRDVACVMLEEKYVTQRNLSFADNEIKQAYVSVLMRAVCVEKGRTVEDIPLLIATGRYNEAVELFNALHPDDSAFTADNLKGEEGLKLIQTVRLLQKSAMAENDVEAAMRLSDILISVVEIEAGLETPENTFGEIINAKRRNKNIGQIMEVVENTDIFESLETTGIMPLGTMSAGNFISFALLDLLEPTPTNTEEMRKTFIAAGSVAGARAITFAG